MSRKVVLIVAAALVSCAAVAAALVALAFPGKPLAWVDRQLAILSVRGGHEVVFEVDADAVRHRANELLRRDAVGHLRAAKLSFNTRLTDAGIEVTAQPNDRQTVIDELRKWIGWINTSLGDDGVVRVSLTDVALAERAYRAAERSRDLITARLSDVGRRVIVDVLPEQQQGVQRLLVRMARTEDPKRLIAFATKPGELGIRLIDDTTTPEKALASAPPPNTDVLYSPPESGRLPYLVDRRVIVSGADIADAQPTFDSRTNEPVVTFRFSSAGTRKFGQATTDSVGRAMAVVVDGEVLAAPVIREPITGGSGQISGNFTLQSANELAAVLRHGELPAKLKVVEVREASGR